MEAFVHTSQGFRLTGARESHIIDGPALPAGGWVIFVSFGVGLWGAPAIPPEQLRQDDGVATVGYNASLRCTVEAVDSGAFAYSIGGSDHFVQGTSHDAGGHPATLVAWGQFTEDITVRLRIESLSLVNATVQVIVPRWIAWKATFTSS